MNRFKKWAGHEYSKNQRMIAVVFGGFIFWVVIPFFIIVVSSYIDQWLHLPKFRYGLINPVIGLVFIVVGWLFANWTVKVQFSVGKGTPIPLMATQKLIVKGPYTYCRNPMTLGTDLFYLGVAIWLGSLSAVGLGLVYPVGILIYIKLIEEKELEERFGSEYLDYKRRTPFLILRLWEKRIDEMKFIDILKLVASVILCQIAGFLGSLFTTPAIPTWYATLKKPFFTPPNWIFSPVWISLFILMGISLFFVWRRPDHPQFKPALIFFFVQLILNVLWSAAFFGLRAPLLGLIDIILLSMAIFLTIQNFFKVSKFAGVLLIPYLLWVSFATLLNFSLLILNL